jgi:hypothetical protein
MLWLVLWLMLMMVIMMEVVMIVVTPVAASVCMYKYLAPFYIAPQSHPSPQLYEEEEGHQEQAEKGHYSSLPAVRHAAFPLTGREDGNALAHLTRRDSESDSQRSNGGSSSTLRGKLHVLPLIRKRP